MIPGLAVATLIGGIVVWGRVRDVEVRQVATWDRPVTVCASSGVDPDALREAVRRWRDQGHDLSISTRICDIQVMVDASLDDRTSIRNRRLVRARTAVEHERGRIEHAEIRVLPDAGLLALCHELGHALGYMHPRAAPTGHLLHPHDPSLNDWRGLGGQDLIVADPDAREPRAARTGGRAGSARAAL